MVNPLILVVEDDPPIRNLIAVTLKAHGYDSLTASTGDAAIMQALNNANLITYCRILFDILSIRLLMIG